MKRRLENEFAEFKGSFPKRKGFQSMLRPGKASDLRLIKQGKYHCMRTKQVSERKQPLTEALEQASNKSAKRTEA